MNLDDEAANVLEWHLLGSQARDHPEFVPGQAVRQEIEERWMAAMTEAYGTQVICQLVRAPKGTPNGVSFVITHPGIPRTMEDGRRIWKARWFSGLAQNVCEECYACFWSGHDWEGNFPCSHVDYPDDADL